MIVNDYIERYWLNVTNYRLSKFNFSLNEETELLKKGRNTAETDNFQTRHNNQNKPINVFFSQLWYNSFINDIKYSEHE